MFGRIKIAAFLVIICLPSCNHEQTTTFQSTVKSRVQFDLSSIHQQMLTGNQLEGVSVLDVLNLNVEEVSGDRQTFSKKISHQDTRVSFTVEVEAGRTQFFAEIFSNNGTLLYRGDEINELNENGFQVTIQLEPVNAVMVVFPSAVTLTPGKAEEFEIVNRGNDSLFWFITEIDPVLDTPPAVFRQSRGFVSPEQSGFLTLVNNPQSSFTGKLVLSIESAVGGVQTEINVSGLADLVPVEEAFQYCNTVFRGDTLFLSVTIRNQGNADAAVNSIARTNFSTSGGLVETFQVIPPLKAGEVHAFEVPIPPGCFSPNCSFEIVVDVNGDIPESNEANNIVDGLCLG